MCVGENNAPQAAHYINSQLSALYENAISCIKEHYNSQRHGEQYRYSYALAQFDYGKFRGKFIEHDEMMFHAKFDKPQLDFICNHDVILRLKITEGHYYEDHSKLVTVTEKHRVQDLSNVEIAFRVPFETREISGADGSIGKGVNQIRYLLLDLHKAELQTLGPDTDTGLSALAFYLTKYLELLHGAGNHILFSLPDFGAGDDMQVKVDFSAVDSEVLYTNLYGIDVERINTYLFSVWLKSAMKAADKNSHWQDYCLSEFDTASTARRDKSARFRVRLGAPRIHAICSREAVMCLNIKDVSFFSRFLDTEESRRYSKWTIALLVRLIPETQPDGRITHCKLDISSATVHSKLCKFPDLNQDDVEECALADRVVQFFGTEYLDILERLEYHIIWKEIESVQNVVTAHSESEVEVEGEAIITYANGTRRVRTRTVVTQKEIVTKTAMHGFDQVIALSQVSIDSHFANLWSLHAEKAEPYAPILAQWDHETFFSATFKPLTVRLLSDNRALITIFLEDCHLNPLRNGASAAEKYSFKNWRLAFEVALKDCSHEDLIVSDAWRARFAESEFAKQNAGSQFRDIYLDFSEALFVHEFSTFDRLFHDEDDDPIEKVQTAIHYIREYYFSELMQAGLHILYTIPVWTSTECVSSHALTSVTFHVYSKIKVTCQNCAQIAPALEPVLLILGMTGHRQASASTLEYSSAWVARVNKSISYGTLAVSQQVFLNRFIELFAAFNAYSTVIPLFNGVENDKWRLELTTWAKHQFRKQTRCEPKKVIEADGLVKYSWEHREYWRYEHQNSSGGVIYGNGAYSVTSVTNNYMEYPATFKAGTLEIKLWGENRLALTFEGAEATKSWSTKSSATWDAALSIATECNGVKVHVNGARDRRYKAVEVEGISAATLSSFCESPEKLLRDVLPCEIDLSAMERELQAFEGACHSLYTGTQAFTLANPALNSQGALLFELSLPGPRVVPTLQTSRANGHSRATSDSLSSPPTASCEWFSWLLAAYRLIVFY
ncbi:hypothetical protein OBBRIDRAFT_731201 [Obba rivulosa]|uniref:Uncharacterized protein n=1 Tax=Obba rivulosa TaxID=1052685 RepID=A0A8E2AXX9_9APHY|nr:hypothetical protein OBBRIDRAFT_731201 [Obba rivulosa]